MNKIKILGTGLTGLVGSRIVELLSDRYEFENVSYETGVDITNKGQAEQKIIDSQAKIVLHLAAKADVDGCEKDKLLGINGAAWQINVDGTKNIVEACKMTGKKIIYISTDFIFDGTKDFYKEEDSPNPRNWYGQTKYEGEKIVQNSGLDYLICRLAFPYRADFPIKKDFFRAILECLKNNQKLKLVGDEEITPTFVDDFAYALDSLIAKKISGFYHVVGSSSQTPLEIGYLIAENFGLDKSLIAGTTREIYFSNRAFRPFSLKLKNDKLTRLGYRMKTFSEGLEELRKQIGLV